MTEGCVVHGSAHPCEECATKLRKRDLLQRISDELHKYASFPDGVRAVLRDIDKELGNEG